MTVIADTATEAKNELRGTILMDLQALGAESVKAVVGETTVAKVSITAGKRVPVIVDEAALLAWVEQEYPHEVVRSVRSSFTSYLIEQMEETDGGMVFKPTGEVLPFVSIKTGAPFVSTRFEKGGRDEVMRALRESRIGVIEVLDMPELEA